MSILAFGGEMGFFIPSDAAAIESSTGYGSGAVDTAFERGLTKVSGSNSYVTSPTVAVQSDFWLHAAIDQFATGGSSSTFQTVINFYDDSAVAFARLRVTSAASDTATWKMEYLSGATWVSVGEFVAQSTIRQTCDFHIVSDTASGSIDMYLSGTRRIASGTVDLSAYNGVASITGHGRTYVNAYAHYFAQFILANESTIGMRVGTIVMTGQGTTHTFTGGGFANIDELVYSDADEINSATAAQVELFTGTPVPSFASYTIRALGIYARAKKSGSGPAQMQLALRSGGTTYFSSTKALDFGFGAIGNVWETNPATSVAFLSSEIAALEYGVKSIT